MPGIPMKRPDSTTGCVRTAFCQVDDPDTAEIKRVLAIARNIYQTKYGGNPACIDEQTVHQCKNYLRTVLSRPLMADRVREYVQSEHAKAMATPNLPPLQKPKIKTGRHSESASRQAPLASITIAPEPPPDKVATPKLAQTTPAIPAPQPQKEVAGTATMDAVMDLLIGTRDFVALCNGNIPAARRLLDRYADLIPSNQDRP